MTAGTRTPSGAASPREPGPTPEPATGSVPRPRPRSRGPCDHQRTHTVDGRTHCADCGGQLYLTLPTGEP